MILFSPHKSDRMKLGGVVMAEVTQILTAIEQGKLARRMRRAEECKTKLVAAVAAAQAARREDTLAAGVEALDGAALGINSRHTVELTPRRLMGMWIPAVKAKSAPVNPAPTILVNDGNFGFRTNRFGFNLSGVAEQVVVIKCSSDLVSWQPLQTNTLGVGPLYFSDPEPATFQRRFYRARLE